MTTPADLVGAFLDLRNAPFTAPGSRLLVMAGEDGWLRVVTAEYERSVDECVRLARLGVVRSDGGLVPVTSVLPHRIEFGSAARLCFVGLDALSLWGDEPGVEVAYQVPGGELERFPLTHGCRLAWPRGSLAPSVETSISVDHEEQEVAAEREWARWFDACPRVRDDLAPMTAYCWWALGANIVHLGPTGDARVVVPSKLGYVGLWQWDAYFIAVGLRHGDVALAREQLSLALEFAGADGQLPDVVHDGGVLASSDDLPPGDVAHLQARGSVAAGVRVPLTKPPLAAWAVRLVDEAGHDEAWLAEVLPAVLASQEWWFRAGEDALPVYDHPYSSGLDDSPVFDGSLPVTTPDLATYLIVQDETLAALLGDGEAAERCRARADRTFQRLMALWDGDSGAFRAKANGRVVTADTVISLLPLLSGRLPADALAGLLAALDDPARYTGAWAVPTVSRADPAFDAEAMWRGPIWLNTNALLIEGLHASGQASRARDLAERTLAMVQTAGGPYEYFNADTAAKPPRAVPMFSWTAALFVDLAVRASQK